MVAYSVLITIMLGTTVFSKNYTIEDAAFPIAVSFYVGFGFNALLDARVAGFDKVLLALLSFGRQIAAYPDRDEFWVNINWRREFLLIRVLRALSGLF